jgi:hypothetical protein
MNKIKRTLRQTYYSDREVEFVFLIDKATYTIKTHDPQQTLEYPDKATHTIKSHEVVLDDDATKKMIT